MNEKIGINKSPFIKETLFLRIDTLRPYSSDNWLGYTAIEDTFLKESKTWSQKSEPEVKIIKFSSGEQ